MNNGDEGWEPFFFFFLTWYESYRSGDTIDKTGENLREAGVAK